MVTYKSTRNSNETATASQAILKGLAENGGLFVPDFIPALDVDWKDLAGMSYQEVAYEVLSRMLTDFTKEELMYCINSAYDKKFDTRQIAPLVKKNGAYYLELFHGPTLAFKDMALSILPYLMVTSAKKNNIHNDIVILTATSGDTGKAALAGFADVPGTKIIVFYPKNGVSPIQEKQMVTQKGANTSVVGIIGNFDDAQTGVKNIFNDKELAKEMDEKGYQFSSANSINIGRLVPQMVYYVYAYARLAAEGGIAAGEPINVVIPTGNFGNILAAYYAKKMGVPIAKFICASNDNKVLYDFFETGVYDKNREFFLTISPSMDVLISTHLERLIYHIAGDDADKNRELMEELSKSGRYEITEEMRGRLSGFYGNYASEAECKAAIKRVYESDLYIMDTHTAVAAAVYDKYTAQTRDRTPAIIASTASPYKFTRSVMEAIDGAYAARTDFELADELYRISGVAIPQAIEDIRNAEVLHDMVCGKDEMEAAVRGILGLKTRMIETERLFLREMNMEDFASLYKVLADSDIMQHYPYTFDEKRVRNWIDRNIERYRIFGFGLWAVCLKETGEMIGDCGLTMQNIGGVIKPEIGYHIRADQQRKGYAREAAAAVRDWTFENTPFLEIYSYMKYTNEPSAKTALSWGCRQVDEFTDEENEITKVFMISKDEWKKIRYI